jgi:antitoxin (DNA-binding transcriptional repressor) of toxin-antitoxin stability system
MTKHINATVARDNLSELLEGVYNKGDEIILESGGQAVGVLIPMAQYEKIARQRAEATQALQAIWANRPPVIDMLQAEQEIQAEVDEARRSL